MFKFISPYHIFHSDNILREEIYFRIMYAFKIMWDIILTYPLRHQNTALIYSTVESLNILSIPILLVWCLKNNLSSVQAKLWLHFYHLKHKFILKS